MKRTIMPLSFGFEMEGEFTYHFISKLSHDLDIDEDDDEYWTEDGSVRHRNPSINIQEGIEEFRSPVFAGKNNLSALISLLKKFTKHNGYYSNPSAGLHFHIGVATGHDTWDRKTLMNLFGDWKWIKEMQDKAMRWSEAERKRIDESTFTPRYSGKKQFIRDINDDSKYRFVRYHPQGTLEFRFLLTTNSNADKVKQVKWIIKEVLDKMNKPLEKPVRALIRDTRKRQEAIINL